MTRQAGINVPGALHHIICRGIERGQIFLDDAESPRTCSHHLMMVGRTQKRILVDSTFVESAPVGAREAMEWKYRLKSPGCDWRTIVTSVSQLFDVPEARIMSSGKEHERVKAKSVAACWAVKEIGMAVTEVGNALGLTQSAVSRAVRRGEKIGRPWPHSAGRVPGCRSTSEPETPGGRGRAPRQRRLRGPLSVPGSRSCCGRPHPDPRPTEPEIGRSAV
jgi:hypothetical protein